MTVPVPDFGVLDAWADSGEWVDRVQRCLEDDAAAWVAATERAALSKDRSWVLLAWVERCASLVVVTRRAGLVRTAAFALSLLADDVLDRRDVLLVASLIRRASELAALDFASLATEGCERAGERGRRCLAWLRKVPERTPSTHTESGSGDGFRFRRVPSGPDSVEGQA
ncbi:hypothetical protein BAY61_20325 [Prauserella marina]|uniref:Uncharacterized protein n=1 Tax=Prauserella marina TaxID=530584 RepID=A0A222VSS8_9PSEU|nr:hypothetical protein [Prauserella marina]ASR36940.1 hypothetical protein BAY61_20325 [Prauserella marina]PWV80107.1 hypothetical protein DES30_103197 [Prauserella marina]SDD83067.1 hypothetical protein SAMN05421630_11320 [Prauserella marina]